LDFDSYGCPNLAIQKAFETIDKSSVPFALTYTDGLGLGMKFNPRINFQKFYLYEKQLEHPNSFFRPLSSHFVITLAKKYGWVASCQMLIQSQNKNFVFATWLIKKK
jgi:hypothetical protein